MKKTRKQSSKSKANGSSSTLKVVSVKVVKPKAHKDVYTLVLLLSFLFFLVATTMIYLDIVSYK